MEHFKYKCEQAPINKPINFIVGYFEVFESNSNFIVLRKSEYLDRNVRDKSNVKNDVVNVDLLRSIKTQHSDGLVQSFPRHNCFIGLLGCISAVNCLMRGSRSLRLTRSLFCFQIILYLLLPCFILLFLFLFVMFIVLSPDLVFYLCVVRGLNRIFNQ